MAKSQVFEQDRERRVGFGDVYDASTIGGNSPLITQVSVSRGIAEALTAFVLNCLFKDTYWYIADNLGK